MNATSWWQWILVYDWNWWVYWKWWCKYGEHWTQLWWRIKNPQDKRVGLREEHQRVSRNELMRTKR